MYVLIKTLGNTHQPIAASDSKSKLLQRLKKEVREHISEYYDQNDEYEKSIVQYLLDKLEKTTDFWTDEDDEYPLSYSIEETEYIN